MKKSSKITDFVHRDPEIMGGVPVFTGTRVPVQALFDYLKGSTIEEFKIGYPRVTDEQISAVLDFAAKKFIKNIPLPVYENAA
ncbi:MAG: DUF433 domain-containing protein [Saprospiraceae bacterium]|jgi:uncharacterized protein (DUF433 family)|nr:DUF433 domain-containing protein [Saprospiraceae bacterium]